MTTILGQTEKPFTTPAYQYVRDTDKLPSTDEAYEAKDPLCRVKVFNPGGAGTWYLAGFDPETGLAYGVADIQERESGDFSMKELLAIRGAFGLPLERDLHWTPRPMSEVLDPPKPAPRPAEPVVSQPASTWKPPQEARLDIVAEPPETAYVVYVLPKGKRTWELVGVTRDYVEQSAWRSQCYRQKAREIKSLRAFPEDLQSRELLTPTLVPQGEDFLALERRYRARRAARYTDLATETVATLEPYSKVPCGQHDGLADALRFEWLRAHNGVSDSEHGWCGVTTSMMLFSGRPETYEFSTYAGTPKRD